MSSAVNHRNTMAIYREQTNTFFLRRKRDFQIQPDLFDDGFADMMCSAVNAKHQLKTIINELYHGSIKLIARSELHERIDCHQQKTGFLAMTELSALNLITTR